MTPMMSEILREEFLDLGHGVDRLGHDLAAAIGDVARGVGRLIGLLRAFGVLLHRAGDLLHRGGGLFQARRLFLGALRQIGGAGRDFRRGAGDLARRLGQRADRLLQLLHGGVEVVLELLVGLREGLGQAEREIALRQPDQPDAERLDGLGLLFGDLGTFVRDFGLRGGLGLRNLRDAVGLDLLALDDFGGFRAGLLVGQHLEALDRIGHVADLVLALETRQHDAEIAAGDLQHRLLDIAQRTGHPARHHHHHADAVLIVANGKADKFGREICGSGAIRICLSGRGFGR